MHSEDARSELTGRLRPFLHKPRRDDVGRAVGKRKKPGGARPAGAPYWLPRGPFWDRLSEGVKRAVGEVLEPAYRRLVLEARDELERSAGITLVHLMWLEICDQAAMCDIVGNREEVDAFLKSPEEAVGRHLHLVAAKNSTAELMLKLRMVRETIQREQQLMGPPEAAPALPAPAAPFGKWATAEARLPRFVEDREAANLLREPLPASGQPADGSPIVGRIGNPPHSEEGAELRPSPEGSCGSEEPGIGKSAN